MNNLFLKRECMENIKYLYGRLKPNGHWFDADTNIFFGTEYPSSAYALNSDQKADYRNPSDNYYYFITSDKHPCPDFQHMKRKYTIRAMDTRTGDICNVGEFGGYLTAKQARNDIDKILGVNTI